MLTGKGNAKGQQATEKATAMTAFGQVMRRLMTERGLSLRKLAKLTSYNVGYLSKVRNGHKPATRKLAAVLDNALGANGELLASTPWATGGRAADRGAPPVALPRQPARETAESRSGCAMPPPGMAADHYHASSADDAGGYGGSQGWEGPAAQHSVRETVLGDQLMAVLAAESQEFGEWIGMSEVADAAIEQYAAQAGRLARDFEYAPVLPLLLETRRLRDHVALHLRGHHRVGQARDLYLIGAQVCGLLAWMTGDLGNYRAADAHAWTAWMCADQAGHDGARAWVRATQAKLAYWDGRYTESAQLAGDGLDYRCADSAGVFLALFRARALARAGKRDQAVTALNQAADQRARAAAPDLLGGVWELTPARYHGLTAGVRLLLDEPGEAVTEASTAIALSEATPVPDRHLYAEMLFRTDQAHAHLRQPDLDGAADVLDTVFDLPAGMRTEPVIQQMGQLGKILAHPRFAAVPRARQLQEQIEDYTRGAALGQLPA